MDIVTLQFILAVIAVLHYLTDTFLLILNVRFCQSHRSIPSDFSSVYDESAWQAAQAYTLAKAKLHLLRSSFNVVLLVFIIYSGVLGYLENALRALDLTGYTLAISYIFFLSFLSGALSLPFSYYHTFVLEERFGFNKSTVRTWVLDGLKSMLLSLILLTPLLLALFYFMNAAGNFWWAYAWLFVTSFQLVVFFLYPVFIAPLFNSFKELEDGALKEKLDALAVRLNFNTAGIYVMDGSRRSNHSNAYFTGFGQNKRIVLYDTLIETLDADQLAAVLAHEIGHEKKRHIKKGMLISILFLFLSLFILSLLMRWDTLFYAFGFATPSNHAALVLFSVCVTPIMFFFSPLTAMYSRKFEYEADQFAVDAVQNVAHLKQALLALSRKSLANVLPHPWYSFFHYSHPTLSERFDAMEEYVAK